MLFSLFGIYSFLLLANHNSDLHISFCFSYQETERDSELASGFFYSFLPLFAPPPSDFCWGWGEGVARERVQAPPPPCECKDRGVCQCPAPSLLFPRERISLGTWGDAAASKLQWPSYLWPLPHSPGVTGVPCPDFHTRVGIQPWVFTLMQQGLLLTRPSPQPAPTSLLY